jgi:hypothetical protein
VKSKFIYLVPFLLTFILFSLGYNKGLELFINTADTTKEVACNGEIFCNIGKVTKNIEALVYDDVLITLRVAKKFLINGNTNFNNTDSAQAATSYLLPIISSPLFLLSDMIAILLFSFFGFFSVYISWYILTKGQSDNNKILLVFVVFLNASISSYMLSGWENIHQSLLILLSWYMVVNRKGIPSYIVIGLLSSLSILMRIDSVFIIFTLYLLLLHQRDYKAFLISTSVGLLVGLIYFWYQLSWFEYITPTTARLKTGFEVDVVYNFNYVLEMLISGSCFLYIIYYVYKFIQKRALRIETKFILFGVFLNLLYALYVSDFFPFGRMFIPAFIILTFAFFSLEKMTISKSVVLMIVAVSFSYFSVKDLKHDLISTSKDTRTATSQQYILAKELKKYISPEDGAIGLFYLGAASFALPNYEVADLLGKADEVIAQTAAIKGQPIGHNKFNPKMSLEKWNIALVPFSVVTAQQPISEAHQIVKNENKYYFNSLMKIELVRLGYEFCQPVKGLAYGVYVRKDLLPRFDNCNKT